MQPVVIDDQGAVNPEPASVVRGEIKGVISGCDDIQIAEKLKSVVIFPDSRREIESGNRAAFDRRQNREALNEILEQRFGTKATAEWMERLQAVSVPANPIQNVAEVMAWDQTRARGFFAELDHPEAGKQVYPTAAYKFSKTPWAGRRAPLLGEHNREIYCERLGYSQQDLARLADSEVI